MKIKGLVDYDICNYFKPSMFIIFPKCSFKCDKECGMQVCQNSALAAAPSVEVSVLGLVAEYCKNPITEAIVCGGLEPFDTWDDLFSFIQTVRRYTLDDIVIYTGYMEKEIEDKINILKNIPNIIIKYGRFIPNQNQHYDEVLGVKLASDNQYARRIS